MAVMTGAHRVTLVRLLVVSLLTGSLLSGACGSSTTTPTGPTTPSSTLFAQAPFYPNAYDSQTSQAPVASGGVLPVQVFDDFTLTSAGNVVTVTWQGQYDTCLSGGVQPVPAAVATAFVVNIFANNGGAPSGSLLNGATYPVGQTNQTFVASNTTFQCVGFPGLSTAAVYNYSLKLNTPFAAAANTRYWLGIQAITPDYSIFWSWNAGAPGNNFSEQISGGVTNLFATDRTFSLFSQ
jgi:hypothetical protein